MCFHHESINYNHFPSIFYFFLFYQYFGIFKQYNYFSTIDQGFLFFKRILEAVDWLISFLGTSSIYQSSSLSYSKITKKIFLDFNLITFFPVDSTSTRHDSKFQNRVWRVKYNFSYMKLNIQWSYFYAYEYGMCACVLPCNGVWACHVAHVCRIHGTCLEGVIRIKCP